MTDEENKALRAAVGRGCLMAGVPAETGLELLDAAIREAHARGLGEAAGVAESAAVHYEQAAKWEEANDAGFPEVTHARADEGRCLAHTFRARAEAVRKGSE